MKLEIEIKEKKKEAPVAMTADELGGGEFFIGRKVGETAEILCFRPYSYTEQTIQFFYEHGEVRWSAHPEKYEVVKKLSKVRIIAEVEE